MPRWVMTSMATVMAAAVLLWCRTGEGANTGGHGQVRVGVGP